MPNENWVGFAKSPKPNPDLVRLSVESTIAFADPAETVFGLVTSASGLSLWLHQVDKTEVRTSGKIKFANVDEEQANGVFSLVEIGRKVVLNSELFGELEVVFEKRTPQFTIRFTKLVKESEKDSQRQLFDAKIASLKLQVGQLS